MAGRTKQRGPRKSAGFILAAMLIFTFVMSGCSSNSNNQSGGAAGGAAGTTGKAAALKVEIFDRGNTPQGYTITDNYQERWIKEQFGKPNNIDVQYVPVPRSEEITKLNVLMASGGDVPDIVFTYDDATYNRYAQQGGLTDVTELLDQYGPDLKKFLGDETLSYGKYDGKQFAIPGKRASLGKYASYIRQDWLDALGMPVPNTTDQLYATLKAFKEKDPGKTGGKVIPLGMTIQPAQIEPLIWSFIKPVTEEQRYTLTQQIGHNEYPPLLPGFKDALQFMNKLYNEGLMSKDFGLDNEKKQLFQDVMTGKVGFFSEDNTSVVDNSLVQNLTANIPTAKLTADDAYSNAEGKHPKPAYDPTGLFIMIPKSSEHAVEAIKYLNWMAQDKNLFQLQNGTEGENYTMKDGIPVAKTDATQEAKDKIYNSGDLAIIANGKSLGDEKKNNEGLILSKPDFQDLVRASVEMSNTDTFKPVRFDKPIEAEAKYGTGLQDKYSQMIVKTTMASTAQFESTYNAMMKDYMSSGGQAILDERTKAYQDMKSK